MLNFLIHPTLEPNVTFQQKKHTLVRCFIFIFWAYLFYFIFSFIEYILATVFEYPSLVVETRALYARDLRPSSLVYNLIFGILIAPLGEEIAFRAFLNFKKGYIALSISGLVYILHRMIVFLYWGIPLGMIYSLLIAAACFVVSYLLLTEAFIDKLKEKFLVLLYLSNAMFVALHLTNYRLEDFNFLNYLVIPIVLFPQILSSIVYSYLRIKNGLVWSIALHAFENAIVAIPAIIREFT